MTKDTTEFTQQNSERAMQAANLGMNWAREFAEQSLDQSKVMLDGLFKVTRSVRRVRRPGVGYSGALDLPD
ncbi:MAG: hypothetical protein WCD13_00490 [Pseudolabrys sp.]